MRLLTTGIAALALTAFAVAPASACPWDKTAQAKQKMTVAEVTTLPQFDTEAAIATNDLSDETLRKMSVLPVPGEKPAE
ncbi:hypothetical protein [Roseibium marinum]|uniref:Uncharacterized protein n=1 Tax=Roseibium marinum TaxID=281252 RepID=A0A2S3V266_9HYPH|nr:hypothetical protein [Roseibium marinum]POF34074.1 hypothetical protein CLV41_101525 [Roseibium marinum]